jgi:hypothetical protein
MEGMSLFVEMQELCMKTLGMALESMTGHIMVWNVLEWHGKTRHDKG